MALSWAGAPREARKEFCTRNEAASGTIGHEEWMVTGGEGCMDHEEVGRYWDENAEV
jgi:hypothetical protein